MEGLISMGPTASIFFVKIRARKLILQKIVPPTGTFKINIQFKLFGLIRNYVDVMGGKGVTYAKGWSRHRKDMLITTVAFTEAQSDKDAQIQQESVRIDNNKGAFIVLSCSFTALVGQS